MGGVAIVAIPNDREPVRRYSSEKVPHMTLLFLGDQINNTSLEHIAEFLQHVVANTRPFGMSVESRGVLGPDNADVLFFAKDRHGKAVPDELRRFLLTDAEILKAYNSTVQYPEWNPHLTMGYPATPAKKDDREYPGFGWIEFDKVALWTSDSDGPTFQLKYPDLEEVDMVMNDRTIDFLSHHGVKGQKWGVRRDKGHEGEQATGKRISKLDKKYEKSSVSKYFAVYNAMADKMNNGEIDRINNDPRFKGKDLSDSTSSLSKAYYNEYSKTATKILNESSDKILGTNASGTKRWGWNYDVEIGLPTASIGDVETAKHADSSVPVKITWNSKGFITKIEIPDSNVEHSTVLEDFLFHFGVKGMHWGQRKSDSVPTGKVTVDQKKPGTKVQAAGGKGFTAHPDAVKAAAAKQVAKNSSTDALSTQELQHLVSRMNLEQQYSKLSAGQTSAGRKFVNDLLLNTAKQQATRIVSDQAGKLVSEQLKKTASRS